MTEEACIMKYSQKPLGNVPEMLYTYSSTHGGIVHVPYNLIYGLQDRRYEAYTLLSVIVFHHGFPNISVHDP